MGWPACARRAGPDGGPGLRVPGRRHGHRAAQAAHGVGHDGERVERPPRSAGRWRVMHRDAPRGPSLLRHLTVGLALAVLPALALMVGLDLAGQPVLATAAAIATLALGTGIAVGRWAGLRYWRHR